MYVLMEIIARGIAAFLFLMLLSQIIGKQLIGKTSYYHYIATISLGSIAGNTVFNVKIKFGYFLLSFAVFTVLTLGLTFISMKMDKARKWISGEPVVVMKNGRILEGNMKKVFLNIDALNTGLRKKDIFDISQVEYAVVEPDGSLSVMKKEAYRGLVKSDLSPGGKSGHSYPVEVIREGRLLEENLSEHRVSEEWLLAELKRRGVSLKEVFYGVKGSDGYLFLDQYKDDPMV